METPAPHTAPPDAPVVMTRDPTILLFKNAIGSDDCEALIAAATPRLKDAQVYHSQTHRQTMSASRTCSEAMFSGSERTESMVRLVAHLAALCGQRATGAQPLHILRYERGQRHAPHFDALPLVKGTRNTLSGQSQRVSTLVAFLTDVESGGELFFPGLGLAVPPRCGDVVYFTNTLSDGRRHPLSLHGSLPVQRGTKWAAVLFFH
jgi:prolyl 4-hydroxylase